MSTNKTEVAETVLKVIQQNRTDGDLYFGTVKPIDREAILFTYGSSEEFASITSELEEHYGIELDDEIGELTVQRFIDIVLEKVQK